MTIAVTAFSPTKGHVAGGEEITIAGGFTVGTSYLVYVGTDLCYGGKYGDGYSSVCYTAGQIKAVLPPLAKGSYTVYVYSATDLGSLAGLQIFERTFYDQMFELRRKWPAWYATGPRDLNSEPAQ